MNTFSQYEEDPTGAIRQLTEMIDENKLEEAVRLGDMYAMVIAHHVKRENFRKAWQFVESCMRDKSVDIRRFLPKETLDQM